MKLKLLFLSAIFLSFFQSFSQSGLTPNQQKIASSLASYFSLDRENIHLHLNKTTYLTNEQIWFKGYLIEKKYKPTLNTSNIYVSLIGENEQKIASQLYFADNGIFEGRVKLDKSLKSGKYYLQAYTNYMNNFQENESSVYEITILNVAEKSYSINNDINYANVTVEFFPEGGTFLEGISNVIGIKITDCNNRGVVVQNAEVLDGNEKPATVFSTD